MRASMTPYRRIAASDSMIGLSSLTKLEEVREHARSFGILFGGLATRHLPTDHSAKLCSTRSQQLPAPSLGRRGGRSARGDDSRLNSSTSRK
jgi:hypothetical protein